MSRQPMLFVTLACLLLTPTSGVRAAPIDVNTTKDRVADEGRCSLREAVTAANTNTASGASSGECAAGEAGPVDVINVPKGQYALTLGSNGDDVNAGGDLDVTESVTVMGAGAKKTVISNGIGAKKTLGDGDRLFHVEPAGTGGVDVTFQGLTLTGGDVGCAGGGCVAGGSAVETEGVNDLVFEDCSISGNTGSCTGFACGTFMHTAAIRSVGGGALTIIDSVVEKNLSTCKDDACSTGSSAIRGSNGGNGNGLTFVFQNSALSGNQLRCSGECGQRGHAVLQYEAITLQGATLEKNSSSCDGACIAGHILEANADTSFLLENSALSKNTVTCRDDGCRGIDAFDFLGDGSHTVRGTVFSKNRLDCRGAGCVAETLLKLNGEGSGDTLLERLTFTKNALTCSGFDCRTDPLIEAKSVNGNTIVMDSTIGKNTLACKGESCNVDTLLDLPISSSQDVTVEDTVVSKNRVSCQGDGCDIDHMFQLAGVNSADAVALTRSRIEKNKLSCKGSPCTTSAAVRIRSGGVVDITQSEFTKNKHTCKGDGCANDQLIDLFSLADVSASDIHVSKNQLACSGPGCEVGDLIHVRADGTKSFVESIIERNKVSCKGTDCSADSVLHYDGNAAGSSLDSSKVVSNQATCKGNNCAVGSVIFNDGPTLSVEGTAIQGNRTGSRGGGIWNGAFSILILTNADITKNKAGDTGGGIFNQGTIDPIVGGSLANNSPNDCVDDGAGTGCP